MRRTIKRAIHVTSILTVALLLQSTVTGAHRRRQ